MIKILFICHGNICRSQWQIYFKRYGISAWHGRKLTLSPAATSYEEMAIRFIHKREQNWPSMELVVLNKTA